MQQTTNYGLPQWEENDLTAWTQLNQPFVVIDTQLKANELQSDQNNSSLNTQKTRIDGLVTEMAGVKTTQAQHTTEITELDTEQASLQADVMKSQTDISNLQTQQNTQGSTITSLQTAINNLTSGEEVNVTITGDGLTVECRKIGSRICGVKIIAENWTQENSSGVKEADITLGSVSNYVETLGVYEPATNTGIYIKGSTKTQGSQYRSNNKLWILGGTNGQQYTFRKEFLIYLPTTIE